MNKVFVTGRQTRDGELRYSNGDNTTAVYKNTVAVNRRGKNNEADFINITAFGKTAEFIDKYGKKGTKWEITGRIQTGSYINKDGQKVYTTDVVVEEVEFAESKNAESSEHKTTVEQTEKNIVNEFLQIPDGIDEELPFN